MKLAIILSATLFLAGCSTLQTSAPICSTLPIYLDADFENRWTAAEKRQVLIVNKSYEEIC